MVCLSVLFEVLEMSYREALRQRIIFRRMAQYDNKAFDISDEEFRMMKFKMILVNVIAFVLPGVALADIRIGLTGHFDPTESSSEAYFYGNETKVISDDEIETFKVSDDNLKYGAKLYFGSRPDDVYIRSPTPWGDLYKLYGWRPVVRVLTPVRATVVKSDSEPQVVYRHEFENNSTTQVTCSAAITQTVENTISSSWFKYGEINVDGKIGYNFEIGFLNTGGYVSMTYESAWGTSKEIKKKVIIGSKSSIDVTLQPGEMKIAELQTLRGTIAVEVDYEATLSGDVAVNFAKEYQGHHFWRLDVITAMTSANLRQHIKSSEVINFVFYGNSKIIIRDKVDPTKISEIQV